MSWLITGVSKAPLLLDSYAGAAAAYSLRQLSWAYGGPVVRVRRSSDNAEADFTATQVSDGSLAAWVGAGNNGFVRTWYDQSGNGRNAEQSTTGNQPQIVSNGSLLVENTKPRLSFNGSTQRLTFAEIEVNSCTCFTIANRIGAAAFQNIIGVGRPTATTDSFVLGVNNDAGYGPILLASRYDTTSGARGGSLNSNAQRLRTGLWNGGAVGSVTSYAAWDNNVSVTLVSTGASTLGNANSASSVIGGVFSGGSLVSLWNGNIQEIIFYPSDLTSSITGVHSNLNAHYAIY